MNKILISENNNIVGLDLKKSLQRFGFNTIGPSNTEEKTIRAAFKHEPDLIVMDIDLGGMHNGINIASLIRNKLNIPIVFISPYLENMISGEVKKMKNLYYVMKPFGNNELIKEVNQALKIN